MTDKPFDPTKPVAFRNSNLPVRIICTDRNDPNMPIIALYGGRNGGGGEGVSHHKANGKAMYGSPDKDLVNVPERTSKFVNVWNRMCTTVLHETREEADSKVGPNGVARNSPLFIRYGVLELQFEDGEFVNAVFHKGNA